MNCSTVSVRLAVAVIALATASFAAAPIAVAQKRPADLETLPPVPTNYTPPKTPWGDYDFSHTYTLDNLADARILFQRPKEYGTRVWVTDEEFARRMKAAEGSDSHFGVRGASTTGTKGLADWMRHSDFAKRTSLLVSPANGRLPPLTPQGQRLYETGRSSWVPGQAFDWVDDFDTWDRCITRGFPASMFPNRYNNGIRIFQSPGYIVIALEMLGTRVIPIGDAAHWPKPLESWMGNSRAHWEGKTLVIETTNIKSGDSATHDPFKRAASPVIVTMVGGAPLDTTPTSPEARTVERLTMTGPNTIMDELTYSDPETYTAPWTAREEWTRDDSYKFYEYACHEGDVQVRNYIVASRAERAKVARGEKPATDNLARFTTDFDHDPGVGAPPPAARPTASNGKEGAGG
ncbi:MAG TPA: hypothetical protein VHX64_07630 [Caulobacteraceae bacterium]|nr:hypothetical protein [Caulobacteraceae bacterium]